jgi:hypothetical protein
MSENPWLPLPRCPVCDAPYEKKLKWNNGDPKEFLFPTCDCGEKEAEARVDAFLANLEERRRRDEP